ncbi:MAG TPA: CHAD domain-containing protein [Candidatus Acidoferrum sp.]|nr:CHAD domain-containing protein [Candidatus Acidoferrum sp.]
MHDYVRLQTAILLRRLAFQVSRTAKSADHEAVHDLRVAIRRLNRCLRAFSQFYPGQSWKKVRRRLSHLMDAAGDVRDRDIAAQMLQEAGMDNGDPAFHVLRQERTHAARHLTAVLHHWKRQSISRRWREELGL